jgi:hypothetical protein
MNDPSISLVKDEEFAQPRQNFAECDLNSLCDRPMGAELKGRHLAT